MIQIMRWLSVLAVTLCVAACQSYWQAEPDFGSSVNDAIRAQAINPDPPKGDPYSKAQMDGVAAKKSIDNYQKSFDNPKADMSNLITINNGASSSSLGTSNR